MSLEKAIEEKGTEVERFFKLSTLERFHQMSSEEKEHYLNTPSSIYFDFADIEEQS